MNMTNFDNVMVDLETYGKRAGCPILAIGAVAFDSATQTLGPRFYRVINLQSCLDAGLVSDPDTIAWWRGQPEAAKEILRLVEHPAVEGSPTVTLAQALAGFDRYLQQFQLAKVKVWGNGADFDNAILATAYAAIGQPQPWEFWHNRCYRTMKAQAPQVKLQRVGIHHNALDDAISQANHLMAVEAHLNRGWWPRLTERVMALVRGHA